jgi:hypothetical protein
MSLLWSLVSLTCPRFRAERVVIPCSAVLARKAVKQRFHPNEPILQLMETFPADDERLHPNRVG